MADEGNRSSNRRMDLNLYLGLPRSPRPRSLDLGSDLALSSVPLLSRFPPGEEFRSSAFTPVLESTEIHIPYSPSHFSFVADPPPALSSVPSIDEIASEYVPYTHDYQSSSPYRFVPDPSYFRAYADLLPPMEDTVETAVVDDGSRVSYNSVPPPGLVDDPLVVGRDFQVAYSPSYDPVSPMPPGHDEAIIMPDIPAVSFSTGASLNGNDRPSLPREFVHYPEFRFRRLINSQRRSQHGYRRQRFRSLTYDDGSLNFGTSSLAAHDRMVLSDNMSTGAAAETSGKKKLDNDGAVDEPLEEETTERSGSAINFECNVCLDLAKEPVVTSCGHLFCWPCLYQWLHLHCDHKECPVCKGEVTDSSIVPIYGRGNLERRVEKEGGVDGDLGLKIPPRPRGRRFDSLRQQIPRPVSRRLGEGITSSLRRIVDEEIRNGNRLEAHARPGNTDGASQRILTRWRARRLLSDGENMDMSSNVWETGPPIPNVPNHNMRNTQDANVRFRFWGGEDPWSRHSPGFAGADRSADMPADLSLVMGNAAGTGSDNNNVSSPSLSSMQNRSPVVGVPAIPPRAADQASASSTMAVIQGDAVVTDASGEPYSAGSSRILRRRGRNNASSSSDADALLHACKRRRLN